MKRIHIIIFLLMFGLMSQSVKAEFVEGLEDIPLPDGLTQVENGNLSFGNEEIRLIEAYLSSSVLDYAAVIHFYQQTLPQMGWKMKQKQDKLISFEREGESLDISEEAPKPLVIRLTVKSKI